MLPVTLSVPPLRTYWSPLPIESVEVVFEPPVCWNEAVAVEL